MRPAKVVIVDDNKDLARALEVRLRVSGFDILIAHDGTSAIDLALAQKPLAVILDLHLPGEDGFSVLEHFQRSPQLSLLPVIVVSADCSPLTQQKTFDAGGRAFLKKPVDHRILLSLLRDLASSVVGPGPVACSPFEPALDTRKQK